MRFSIGVGARAALAALGAFTAPGAAASGQGPARPRLTVQPVRPEPGAIVRLTLSGARGTPRAIAGELAGEPLHFVAGDSGRWRAIGGIPVNAAASLMARVIVTLASGRTDTVRARVVPAVIPPPKAEPLTVDTAFTALDSSAVSRVASENARAREVGRRSHDTPRMWDTTFLEPRASAVTGRFGGGRYFNGRVTSRHLGVDFKGAVGDTVRAANRGVVALVDGFLLAGNVLYVDHGAGVVTGYFHLSQTLVSVGDTVARGQPIALVGATGRVTGAHLHWSARYGSLTVNALDLVTLDRRWATRGAPVR